MITSPTTRSTWKQPAGTAKSPIEFGPGKSVTLVSLIIAAPVHVAALAADGAHNAVQMANPSENERSKRERQCGASRRSHH
jgi:hypothetical protein